MPKLMEVLEFLDDTGATMVRRIPESGDCEVKWGAQLTVRESQVAVFFRDGKSLDVFGPGRHVLQTQNIPLVGKWVTSFGYGPASPFRSEVYFLNMKLFPNLKWGTREPILFRDEELKMIRLRSHGILSIQIKDPMLFLNKIVGTSAIYHDTDIEDYLRNIVVTRLTDTLGNQKKSIFDIPKELSYLSVAVRQSLTADFEGLGITLHDFYINSISLPPEVQEIIDAKTSMSALGSLDEFMKFKAAIALESAAKNPDGSASAGVGMGAGLGMGFMLPKMLQDALQAGQGAQGGTKESPADRIKKLKELFDIGAISKEEYEEKKKKLLQEI
jgi:membrane protease subunit (stomatin/prohibitin family)